eukprot:scaffold575_cov158-Chaetoceros_neogracile.AAC.2
MGKNNTKKEEEITLSKKDQKKVFKLTAMIPYHEGRRNDAEVAKIKEQVESIWQKTKEAAWAMNN